MSGMLRRFRHNMTNGEVARRQEAALAALNGARHQDELPPSIIAETLAEAEARAKEPPAAELSGASPAEAVEPAPALPRHKPDLPVVRVTISAAPGHGRRTIAHVIRQALAHRGIAFDGPAALRSTHLGDAVHGLIDRGVRVELAFEETPE